MLNIQWSRATARLFIVALTAATAACGGGGSSSSSTTTTTTTTTVTPVASAISLSTSTATVASDGSTSATVVATVVDASNGAVANVPVAFSVDSGLLSSSSALSDTTGKATITFSAGSNPTTRTATITATASGQTTQIPIRVSGSTLTVTTGNSSLTIGASTTTISVVAKNSAGTLLSGQTITLAQAGTGTVSLGSSTGTTDSTGTFTTTITPTTAGTATITVTGVGETRTTALSITGVSASAFQITTPAASSTAIAGTLNTGLTFTVAAPSPTTSVTFVSTLGTWNGGTNILVTSPVSGVATATLTATAAGVANVLIYDTQRLSTLSDSRVVSFTAPCTSATNITLQSTPSVVATSAGGTNIATLIATVTAGSNPVGNCPVAFNILNPTGGGETVTPAVVLTNAVGGGTVGLGQATATFTAGSLPSGASGVKVHATVVGTSVATGTATSSDAAIVIGGTAGSVTIGVSTVIGQDSTSTNYILPMTVLVSDSNGNPVANATVSLSAWPIAFNVGGSVCVGTTPPGAAGVFYYNEDVNENLTLDAGEDGVRKNYSTGVTTTGTSDGLLTPVNSAAGTLPATVTTTSNGTATFNLTYTKSSALWIIDRIRARTIVQGTATLGQTSFVLPALQSDVTSCLLAPSPYQF